jgi:hypothetical protein
MAKLPYRHIRVEAIGSGYQVVCGMIIVFSPDSVEACSIDLKLVYRMYTQYRSSCCKMQHAYRLLLVVSGSLASSIRTGLLMHVWISSERNISWLANIQPVGLTTDKSHESVEDLTASWLAGSLGPNRMLEQGWRPAINDCTQFDGART